jgi:hypothetical protein
VMNSCRAARASTKAECKLISSSCAIITAPGDSYYGTDMGSLCKY